MAKGKPVILSDYKSDEIDPIIFGQTNDPYYIPGYTEILKANSIAEADDFRFTEQHQSDGITKQKLYDQIGCHPRELQWVFGWVRIVAVDGTVSGRVSTDMYEYTSRGYEKVDWRRDRERIFGPNGWGFPPGAVCDADGTVRRDDLALFVVDGRRHRAWEAWQKQYTHERENPLISADDGRVEVQGTIKRETLTVTTEG